MKRCRKYCQMCNRVRRRMCEHHEQTCAMYTYFASLVIMVTVLIAAATVYVHLKVTNNFKAGPISNDTVLELTVNQKAIK